MWEYVEMVEDCIFDTVIQNGTVVDGSGGSRFKSDVGIKNNRICLLYTSPSPRD